MPKQDYPTAGPRYGVHPDVTGYPTVGPRYGSHPDSTSATDDILTVGGDPLTDSGTELKNG